MVLTASTRTVLLGFAKVVRVAHGVLVTSSPGNSLSSYAALR